MKHALATIAPGLLVVLVVGFVLLISAEWAPFPSPSGSALLSFIWFCAALLAAVGIYYRDQERNVGLPTWTENRRARYMQGTYGQSHTV